MEGSYKTSFRVKEYDMENFNYLDDEPWTEEDEAWFEEFMEMAKEAMLEEAEAIEREIEADPDLKDVEVSPELEKRIFVKIREMEEGH